MRRASFVLVALLVPVVSVACESDKPTTNPEPTPAPAPEVEPEPDAAPEPTPEPEPDAAPEVKELAEPVVSKDGFEARDLHCTWNEPSAVAGGYIRAGLTDPAVDAALDACAPKGAAIEVEWSYVSGAAQNVSVAASSSKQANCVAAAMQLVHAGVEADCKAVLLLGDSTAATAAYEAR